VHRFVLFAALTVPPKKLFRNVAKLPNSCGEQRSPRILAASMTATQNVAINSTVQKVLLEARAYEIIAPLG
jgi:hypothetical protein